MLVISSQFRHQNFQTLAKHTKIVQTADETTLNTTPHTVYPMMNPEMVRNEMSPESMVRIWWEYGANRS